MDEDLDSDYPSPWLIFTLRGELKFRQSNLMDHRDGLDAMFAYKMEVHKDFRFLLSHKAAVILVFDS